MAETWSYVVIIACIAFGFVAFMHFAWDPFVQSIVGIPGYADADSTKHTYEMQKGMHNGWKYAMPIILIGIGYKVISAGGR